MTGEEFLCKVREIKEIHSIDWDIQGNPWDADSIRVKIAADNEEFTVSLGSPSLSSTAENLLSSIWWERVAVCLLVNKTMELLGRPERFNVECGLNISNAISFAMKCTQELHKNT